MELTIQLVVQLPPEIRIIIAEYHEFAHYLHIHKLKFSHVLITMVGNYWKVVHLVPSGYSKARIAAEYQYERQKKQGIFRWPRDKIFMPDRRWFKNYPARYKYYETPYLRPPSAPHIYNHHNSRYDIFEITNFFKGIPLCSKISEFGETLHF